MRRSLRPDVEGHGLMANVKAVYEKPLRTLDDLGAELLFFLRALAWTPKTVVR